MTTTLADLNLTRKDDFHLVKPINDDVWLAERLPSRERFIARRLTELDLVDTDLEHACDAEGLVKLLSECGIDSALTNLLNHENILSLAGFLPKSGDSTSTLWLIWDFPDAGTLSQLLHDRELAAAYTGKRYMPEALVWHVLRGILSALLYLHEGSRLYVEEDDPVQTWRRSADEDWHPVLHGAVTAENIFFQHPRGTEEYGVCKLGNFSGAYVSGKVSEGPLATAPETGIVAGLKDGKIGTLDEIRKNLYTTVDPKTNTRKTYTINDELWSLGAVVHQMMVGAPPPSPDGCKACNYECTHLQVCSLHPQGCAPFTAACACDWGGCPHMPEEFCPHPKYATSCPHKGCSRKNIRFQDNLWRKHYSRQLIGAVLMLLQPGRQVEEWSLPGKTAWVWDEIEVLYQEWLHTSWEGLEYQSIEDDLLRRDLEVEKRKRGTELRVGERESAEEKRIRRGPAVGV